MSRGGTPTDQRQSVPEPTDDVYCGVVSAPPWPFGDPLIIELVVARGSVFVKDVHISAPLAGLKRYLRHRVCEAYRSGK